MDRIDKLKEELDLLISIKEIKKEIADLENKTVNQQIVYVPLPYIPWSIPQPYIPWSDCHSTGDSPNIERPFITC